MVSSTVPPDRRPVPLRAFAWFAVGAVVLLALVSLLYEIRIAAHDRFRDHFARYSDLAVQPQVVVFGDSRGVHALRNAALADGMLNLSYFGESLLFHYLRLQDLLRSKTRLRAIVVPVNDYFLSTYRYTESFERYLLFANATQILDLYPHGDSLRMRLRFLVKWFNYHVPLAEASNRRTLTLALLHDAKAMASGKSRDFEAKTFDHCLDARLDVEGMEDPGWATLSADERAKLAAFAVRRKRDGRPFDRTMGATLRRIVALAREHGIAVLGIRHPLTPEWRRDAAKFVDPRIARAYAESGLDHVFDYRDLFDDRPDYFLNPDHLSPAGAAAYSRVVARDVTAYLGLPDRSFDCATLPQ